MADRATIGQWSFNGGEVSPRIRGRLDQAIYQIAADTMLGWIPFIQGPAIAAPGTIFVEAAAGPCRLIPFEYNVTQGYVVEASNLKLRFYTNDARIETTPGVPYEVVSPYSFADLADLDFQQSADVLYLVGAGKKPRKLNRTGAETFTVTDLALRNGPIGPGNSDETLTVTVSATTGVGIIVTASAAIFAATDVGGFFEIEARDFSDVPSWEPGITVSQNDKRSWAGKVYRCATATAGQRTGTVPPEHDSGTEWDGMSLGTDINAKGPYGVQWEFLYGRYGLVTITGFTSATVVTATVVKRLADSLVSAGSWRWAHGAFSDTRGWPETVCIWDECLLLTKGNAGYPSVVGDYENFERRDSSGDFQRDLAGSFSLPGPHKIVWSAADRILLLGTETGEYTVERLQIQTGTPGPPVFQVRLQSSNGSRKKKPIQADGRLLFVQRAGRKLREMGYAITADRYSAPDMTRLADHIGQSGFTELAWAAEPERLAWAVGDDGMLAAMTYDPDQQVMGWCRRSLGNDDFSLSARSACRITDPEGRRDQIWVAAETPDAAHWVLRMAKIWETGDDPEAAILLDACLSYDGAPADEISGLDHLEGRTVQILAAGKPHPERVVDGGAITLDYEAAPVHVGLGFPAIFKTLPPEGGQSEGTAQTKLKRVVGTNLRVAETQGIRVRVQGGDFIPVETRVPADAMDQRVPLFSGDISIPTIGRYDRTGQIEIERYQPTPATIVAIVPVLAVGEI